MKGRRRAILIVVLLLINVIVLFSSLWLGYAKRQREREFEQRARAEHIMYCVMWSANATECLKGVK